MEQRLRLVQAGARADKRAAERRRVQVPGQIVWKDHRGQTRMAAVMTRDVSEQGVSFESRAALSVPMYRLVYFQIDRHARSHPALPAPLRKQNVLSAIFRIGKADDKTGTPSEYAVRLLVEPRKGAAGAPPAAWSEAGENERTRTA